MSMSMLADWLGALQWVVAVAGVLVAWRYFLGRPGSQHPSCARCGYDLRGRRPDSPRCPECGAHLAYRDAIAVARRVRRVGPAALTLVLTVLACYGIHAGSRAARAYHREALSRPMRFVNAVRSGDQAAVAALLKRDPSLPVRASDTNNTALGWAAVHDESTIAQLLIDHGAPTDPAPLDSFRSPLDLAAEHGSMGVMNVLLRAGVNVNGRDRAGKAALHTAARSTHAQAGQVLSLLLGAPGIDVNAADATGRTPLHEAAEGASVATIAALLQAGATVNARDGGGNTPLHLALMKENRANALVLIDAGADLGLRNAAGLTPTGLAGRKSTRESWLRDFWDHLVEREVQAGRTDRAVALLKRDPLSAQVSASYGMLLHSPVVQRNLNIARALIELGADVSASTENTAPPIHRAAHERRTEMVRLLIESGADVDGRDADGRTALHRTQTSSNPEMTKLLLELGADPSARDRRDDTPATHAAVLAMSEHSSEIQSLQILLAHAAPLDIHILVALGSIDAVRTRIEQDPALADDADNLFGRSPLHIAAGQGAVELVRLLLDRGADANRGDIGQGHPGGRTPLHLAVEGNRVEVVELLLSRGADVRATDDFGQTLLHEAARGSPALVKLLLARGLDPNAPDRFKQTPLHSSAQSGNIEAIQLLLAAGADRGARDEWKRTPAERANVNPQKVKAALEVGGGTP